MLTAVYDTRRSTDVMEIQKDAQYLKEEMTGCIYRHFKGGLYIVTDVVVNSESLEIEVIYKDFTPSQLTWSRDLKQFFSGVNTTKYPDALQRVRFKKVGGVNMSEKICGVVILAIIYLLLAWKASDLWRK